uniref:Leucine-rich repeat protein n=1 Tax=Paramoeba aestuarina TaxID=180227 RepID=A0A7S4KIT3_9EUKA|mmetsp:Transcript_19984/g.31318  ORF Transcript_19984/g.31318 Transcript_19984/m.31318 type:complete len:227 (+) Transcript_19984:39-719(+)
MFFATLSVDPSLGKSDKSSLSQQTLMELFVENITNRQQIWGSREKIADLKKWQAIALNADDDVTSIEWTFFSWPVTLRGSLSFQWLPSTIEQIQIIGNSLSGTIDLEHLPDSLRLLDVALNDLAGSICLTNLPNSLTILNVSHNKLNGTLDLTKLPHSLRSLDLSQNFFVGETDFSQLPASLTFFTVEANVDLSGKIRRPVGFAGEHGRLEQRAYSIEMTKIEWLE